MAMMSGMEVDKTEQVVRRSRSFATRSTYSLNFLAHRRLEHLARNNRNSS